MNHQPSTIATILLLLVAAPLTAAENWFLPYEPDEHTLFLAHLDREAELAKPHAKGPVTLTLKGGAQLGEGFSGRGLALNGDKQTLMASASKDVFQLRCNQPFTVECWVRPESGDAAGLLSIGTRFYFQITPGKNAGTFGYRAASFPIRYYPVPNVRLPLRRWSHLALTHDADRTVRVYVNGQLAWSLAHSDEGDYEKGGGASFGAHDGWSRFFHGAMDEIRISDCVREFRPLLDRHHYIDREPVALTLDASRLPAAVEKAVVSIRDRQGKAAVERELPRERMAEPLLTAGALPPGEHQVEIAFLDKTGQPLSKVTTPIANSTAALASATERLATLRSVGDSPRAQVVKLYAERIAALLKQRDLGGAEQSLRAAETVAQSVASGEAAYRQALRTRVRDHAPRNDVRIIMSWGAKAADAPQAFPWAKRLGANALVASIHDAEPAGIKLWKDAGYRTVCLGSLPIHDHAYGREHPEAIQQGWWVTKPAKAEGSTVKISVLAPSWDNSMRVSYREPPEQRWRVVDVTTGDPVPAASWSVEKQSHTLTLKDAKPGHGYQVYFTFGAQAMCDPLHEGFAKHAVERLDGLLKPFAGVLDTYWFDDLGFAYPGPVPQGGWDWESYTLAASPENVKRFTAATGIQFDPRWLVMAPRTIELPPDRRYLAWQKWVQDEIRKWMAQAAAVPARHGMTSWLYWGDCHVGIEPFLGSLTAGGIQEIDKPAADAVTARALVDFPGEVYRSLRTDWIFPETCTDPRSPARLKQHWVQARRGLLMKPARGLYWFDFSLIPLVAEASLREDLVETLAEINDEFRLIGEELAGASAWRTPLNVYVLNAWGAQYSWRPWGAATLVHLTDLPATVRFISFVDVEQSGIPPDAHVLLNYGGPGSSWSGGHFWQSEKVVAAIDKFVRDGGGFVGLGWPGYLPGNPPRGLLAELLGARHEGASGFQPATVDASMLADTGQTGQTSSDSASQARATLVRTKASPEKVGNLPPQIPAIADAATVSAAQDAALLYALRRADGSLAPGVTLRQHGKGRAVYLAGASADSAFTRLFQSVLYLAAQKPEWRDLLLVEKPDHVFAYAYPNRQRLVVANGNSEPVTATVKASATALGLKEAGDVALTDMVTNEVLWRGAASSLDRGVNVSLPPACARVLHVRTR